MLSIPENCTAKTVSRLTAEEAERIRTILVTNGMFAVNHSWREQSGYGTQHGPFYDNDTVIRYWFSREHAETWKSMMLELFHACGLEAESLPMDVIDI
jgi:hypothetical protein